MVDRPPIGAVIREVRLALGYTQAKLASLCDITPQYLSLLELGEVNVSLDTLLSISAVLGEPLSSLIAKAEAIGSGQKTNRRRLSTTADPTPAKKSKKTLSHDSGLLVSGGGDEVPAKRPQKSPKKE